MKFRLLRILILSAAAATTAVISPARLLAQGNPYERREPPWLGEVTCKDDKERQRDGAPGGNEFRICFQVPEEKLYARQDEEIPLDLVIKVYAAKETKKLGLTSVTPERNDPNLIIDPPSPEPQEEHGRLALWKTYKYRLTIKNGVKPRLHRLKVNGVIGNETLSVDYDLPIGAEGEGWVDITGDSQKSATCWSGWTSSECEEISLNLQNKLDYQLEVKVIALATDPPGLVKDVDVPLMKPPTIAGKLSPQQLKLTPWSMPISWSSIFSGFGKSPKLFLTITFKDDYGREPYSKAVVDLQMKPNFVVLAIFLLLGAVVGTIVRIDLGRLQRAGVITRKQKAVFAATTFATGVLVCLIALFANVKLVVLNDQNYSAWDPKVLFLTALVATVSGLPILYALLKLPKQPEPDTRDKGAPARHRPRARRDDE